MIHLSVIVYILIFISVFMIEALHNKNHKEHNYFRKLNTEKISIKIKKTWKPFSRWETYWASYLWITSIILCHKLMIFQIYNGLKFILRVKVILTFVSTHFDDGLHDPGSVPSNHLDYIIVDDGLFWQYVVKSSGVDYYWVVEVCGVDRDILERKRDQVIIIMILYDTKEEPNFSLRYSLWTPEGSWKKLTVANDFNMSEVSNPKGSLLV